MESGSQPADKAEKNNKIVVILGPTSSGKSTIAIKLAQKFDGEIISADSRQIYRGMDIGTGKVTLEEQALAKHWMLDVVSPKTDFSAAKFKQKADRIIADILRRNKIPIICGGTGFWIKALVDNVAYPEVKPDQALRKKLETDSTEELFAKLEKLDPVRAKNIDAKNRVRLIRAIEICQSLGTVPEIKNDPSDSKYRFLQIGISLSKETLHKNIQKRLEQRFSEGMITEVKGLHKKQKLSWSKIRSFGLGYALIPDYLLGKIISQEELLEKAYLAEKDYAKRQMTWFSAQGRSALGGQKNKRIEWLETYQSIEIAVNEFLKN